MSPFPVTGPGSGNLLAKAAVASITDAGDAPVRTADAGDAPAKTADAGDAPARTADAGDAPARTADAGGAPASITSAEPAGRHHSDDDHDDLYYNGNKDSNTATNTLYFGAANIYVGKITSVVGPKQLFLGGQLEFVADYNGKPVTTASVTGASWIGQASLQFEIIEAESGKGHY